MIVMIIILMTGDNDNNNDNNNNNDNSNDNNNNEARELCFKFLFKYINHKFARTSNSCLGIKFFLISLSHSED